MTTAADPTPARGDARLTGGLDGSGGGALEHPGGAGPHTARGHSRLAAVSWRHWFREVAVIAAGALAALAAQAWWQDRQDAERERDYLRHLVVDTSENVRRVDEAIAADSASGLAQARVANALYGAGATLPADTLMRLLVGGNGSAFSASNFQPVAGTYTALLATGDLRRVPVALPDMRLAFTGRTAMRAAAARVPFQRLRTDPDMASLLFTLQASTANRLNHLRGIRGDTRQLLAALQPRHVAAGGSAAHDSTPRTPK